MIRTALALLLATLTLTAPSQARPPAQAQEEGPRGGGLPAGTLAVGKRALPPAGEAYDPSHLVWAKGTRLHDADMVSDLAPWRIDGMQRTPHGFFLRVSRPRRDDHRTAWYDGHSLTWIAWSPSLPEVSPDGRLAGWVDRGGPMIRYGRAGRIVVVDLVTGRVVFSTSRWMGKDTDLYEEIYPVFHGFDDRYAYWSRVVGDVRRVRTDLTTWATTPAATSDEYGYETPIGLPLDPYTGTPVTLLDGRPTDDGEGVEPGFVSADGRFAFNMSATARLQDHRRRDGRPGGSGVGQQVALVRRLAGRRHGLRRDPPPLLLRLEPRRPDPHPRRGVRPAERWLHDGGAPARPRRARPRPGSRVS